MYINTLTASNTIICCRLYYNQQQLRICNLDLSASLLSFPSLACLGSAIVVYLDPWQLSHTFEWHSWAQVQNVHVSEFPYQKLKI